MNFDMVLMVFLQPFENENLKLSRGQNALLVVLGDDPVGVIGMQIAVETNYF